MIQSTFTHMMNSFTEIVYVLAGIDQFKPMKMCKLSSVKHVLMPAKSSAP